MDYITIRTTQNVSIDYPLANVGQRLIAFLIDLFAYIFVAWMISLSAIRLLRGFIGPESIVFMAFFGFLLSYYLSELFFRGRTPGKKIMGLRVVRLDGNDPTPADYLIRALFLLADILLTAGVPAVLLIATSRQNQRLGDMVATTAVIRDEQVGGRDLANLVAMHKRTNYEAEFPGVQRYTNEDMLTVKQTLERHRRFGNAAHRKAIRLLARRIGEDLGLDPKQIPYSPPEFLQVVLKDYIILTR